MLTFVIGYFRCKMRVTCTNFNETMALLACCPSLVRLGIIGTSIDLAGGGKVIDMYEWDEERFTAFFVDMVKKLPKLIALLVVLPGAPQSLCTEATTNLENIYKPRRPCFCVQITSELNSSITPKLPFCHHKVLADEPPPLVGTMPFHLLSHEPRF